jgi:PAS domain S-box-containing protein
MGKDLMLKKTWKRSLTLRLVLSFLFLSLLVVGILGFVAGIIATETIKQSVFERLDTSVNLKEDSFNKWVDDQIPNVVLVSMMPALYENVDVLVSFPPPQNATGGERAAYNDLSDLLSLIVTESPYTDEIMITDGNGTVIVSSDRSHEGMSLSNAPYIEQGRQRTYVQSIHPSPLTGRKVITIVTPIFNARGSRIGMLASDLSKDRIDRIIIENSGLGMTGETYLIDKSHHLVSDLPLKRQNITSREVRSEGIDRALTGIDGSGVYLSYGGIPVIGVYRWIDEREVALIAEMSAEEAFEPANRLAWTIFIIGAFLAGVLALLMLIVGRQITRPLLAITEAAIQVTGGDLTIEAPVTTEDEVGTLAKAFNQMTDNLKRTLLGLEHNIAELEQTRDALSMARSHLYTIIDSIADPVFVKDRHHRWVVLNDAFCRMVGHSREELIGRTDRDFFPEGEYRIFLERDDSVFTIRKEDINEESLTDATGKRHILLTKKAVFRSPDGEDYLVGVASDITEIRDAEEEARQLNRQIEFILGATRTGLDIIDGDFNVRYVNPEWQKTYGNFTGRKCFEYFMGRDTPCPGCGILEAIRTRRTIVTEETLVREGDRPVQVTTIPFQGEDGEWLVAEVNVDISERIHHEQEIRLFNEELEERVRQRTSDLERATREMESFSYSVSHDLRAPLRAIDGYSSILLNETQERLNPPDIRLLTLIRQNINQMALLIEGLLNLSKIGKQAPQKEQIDMEALVREVFDTMKEERKGRDITLEIGKLSPCLADMLMIRQVYSNLLSNALKFTRSRKKTVIEVGSFQREDDIVYFVRDNGIGFDMKFYNKLFGVFQRLHTIPGIEGTGVGLAIVHRIIQRHGGRIWAESEHDKGATFYFTLGKKG